jgi:DNA-binding transcriptional MerR regulator/methanogenic corrinoid protein MtbC1
MNSLSNISQGKIKIYFIQILDKYAIFFRVLKFILDMSLDTRDTERMGEEQGYPIRVVSKKTGLSVHVIRAWEKRYGAVNPRRTPRGQRLYSKSEIERLTVLAAAVRGGWSIGSVVRLSGEELDKAVKETETAPAGSGPAAPGETAPAARGGAAAETILAACMKAVENLDDGALSDALFRGSVELGKTALIDDVIVPLMRLIGEAWREDSIRILHEHAASAVVRSYLGGLLTAKDTRATAPCAVAATLSGELHELGAIVAAVAATTVGWRVRYLGPNTPADEIVRAAEITGSRAVLISMPFVFDERRTPEEIGRVRRFLSERCVLILGGSAAVRNRAALSMPGVEIVDDLKSLRRILTGEDQVNHGPVQGVDFPNDGRESRE